VFEQGGLLNTWTVVAKSAEFAFDWTDQDLQLMQMWIYISYLIAMLPFAWLLDKKGKCLNGLTVWVVSRSGFCYTKLSNLLLV